MKTSGNTVLITGGATGIGFALAQVFLREGNEVIICGRRKDRLLNAKSRLPALNLKVCDVAGMGNRKRLFDWAHARFPNLNILVNNAGVQMQVDLTKGLSDLTRGEDEIAVNFEAPLHLSALFIPHLMRHGTMKCHGRGDAAIINVSSGLAFIPMAVFPVYCATKAALHSFCLSLRHQLAATGIKVFEVIPPRVDSELGIGAGKRGSQDNRGIPPEDVAEATLKGMAQDEFEIAVGMAQGLRMGSRSDPEGTFQQLNRH